MRFAAFSTMALLLYSTGAKADCIKPAWPDSESLGSLTRKEGLDLVFSFQNRVHEFIACQRASLEQRASGLAPSDVGELILRDRAAEERALAEVNQLDRCMFFARSESDPATVRKKCEGNIQEALQDRRPPEPPDYTELKSEQRSEYGGVLRYRTLDFGRPGECSHGECDKLLGVEVTNLTPVALRCEVALAVSNREDGTRRGEQVIRLNPGDSLPAAQVRIDRAPVDTEPEVTCSRATPLASESRVPAACVLNWLPRSFRFSESTRNYSWWGGTALLDFTARQNHKPPEAIYIVGADSPGVGQKAQELIEKLSLSTNCDGQRFRIRVEYRAFPCFVCSGETGVVTLYRDDRDLQ